MPSTPDAAEVARIASHPDPALRNVLITHGYHELAVAARARLGPGANWCTFATWASRQAGHTIRREDMRQGLRARLGASSELHAHARTVAAAVGNTAVAATAASVLNVVMRALDVDGVLDRAASAVATGNRKVFEEIATQFALFLDALDADSPHAVEQFLAAFPPGDPPAGRSRLREAFEAYIEAIGTASPNVRAQLLHYANLLIAMHEQIHLQPEIAAAMNCAFEADRVRDRLLAALLPGVWRRIRYRIAGLFGRRPPLDAALDRLLAEVQRELRRLITANAMTLDLPGAGTIRLGRDLRAVYAPSLTPVTEPRLTELLHRLDPVPDSLAGTAATDWSMLEQRLHLVADLFRCHHDASALFEPPFSASQVTALRSGRLPEPPL